MRRPADLKTRSAALVIQLVAAGVVVLFWYWQTREGGVSPLLVPKPEEVAREIPELLNDGRTWRHIRVTAFEILAAFGLSATTGLVVGFWAGRSDYLTRLIEPILVSVYMAPLVLLYPIVLLFFGVGPTSKIVFAGCYGFFPVALNTMRGSRSAPQGLIRLARSMGASTTQMVRWVRLPAARPVITAGLRYAAALNLIGVIVGEILAAREGIGSQIARTSLTFDTAGLYAYIAIALVFVAALNRVISARDVGMGTQP